MQIIMASWNNGDPTPVFNNAAQVWNHTFFWEGMAPDAGGAPSGDLAAAIDSAFGSFDAFKEQFAAAGATQFGSGWAWLVANKDGSLEIMKSPNAVNAMVNGVCLEPSHTMSLANIHILLRRNVYVAKFQLCFKRVDLLVLRVEANHLECAGKTAILTMDVWEHAYYLDFQNARPAYINTYMDKLIAWDKIAERYAAATA